MIFTISSTNERVVGISNVLVREAVARYLNEYSFFWPLVESWCIASTVLNLATVDNCWSNFGAVGEFAKKANLIDHSLVLKRCLNGSKCNRNLFPSSEVVTDVLLDNIFLNKSVTFIFRHMNDLVPCLVSEWTLVDFSFRCEHEDIFYGKDIILPSELNLTMETVFHTWLRWLANRDHPGGKGNSSVALDNEPSEVHGSDFLSQSRKWSRKWRYWLAGRSSLLHREEWIPCPILVLVESWPS